MTVKRLFLKRHEEQRLLAGHAWAFSNELREIQGSPAAGDIVELYDNLSRFLGRGFYNPRSLIAFRFLTRGQEEIGPTFWRDRIAAAVAYRVALYPAATAYRAVYGESDALPGLIVDRYGAYLAVQFLSAGMDAHQADIVRALQDVLQPTGIMARNDSALRALEGLPDTSGVIAGTVPDRVTIEENGCRFLVDLQRGQKTGFFFDQRENRAALARYCAGKRMLDAFCHTGAFGIAAAAAGASRVVWADASRAALDLAAENAAANNLAGAFSALEVDLFDYFERPAAAGGEFDIINLDPPALIKSKKHHATGFSAYRKLNAGALRLLKPGGLCATSSCSHHLSPAEFRTMLEQAAARAGKQVRLLDVRSQGRDHPILLSMPETEYLKFAILQVV
jgi:23S rRNA (cytosine1962-C5)-methyltransferase